jgi:ribosomal protein S21
MTNVQVKVNGDVAKALRRFRKKCEREAVLADARRYSFYGKPGEKWRVKHARVLTRAGKVAALLG